MAETIDLTPQSANYTLGFKIGSGVTPIVPGTPLVIDPTDFIEGTFDRAQIVIGGVSGVMGVFKRPPFALNVTLNDVTAVDADSAVMAHLDKGIICTPDGRIFFDPSFASMVVNAMFEKNLLIDEIASIVLNMTAIPVYRNPSGETPAYTAKTFDISFDMGETNIAAMAPNDLADAMPWAAFSAATNLTPASIDVITGV